MVASLRHPPGYRNTDGRLSQLRYQFVWTVRRRRSVLIDGIAARLEARIREIAAELDLEIIALAVEPSYVHLQVAATPDLSPTQIVYRLKSATAATLRGEYPQLMRLPSMWNGTYLVSSERYLSDNDINEYVHAQSTRA